MLKGVDLSCLKHARLTDQILSHSRNLCNYFFKKQAYSLPTGGGEMILLFIDDDCEVMDGCNFQEYLMQWGLGIVLHFQWFFSCLPVCSSHMYYGMTHRVKNKKKVHINK